MNLKQYAEEVIKIEASQVIAQQGFFLETPFCNMVYGKYSFAIYTVRAVLRRIFPELSLTKRRLSDEIKHFYGLEAVKGCPIIYIESEVRENECARA